MRKTIAYESPTLGTVHVEFFTGSGADSSESDAMNDQEQMELEAAMQLDAFTKGHYFYALYPKFLQDPDTWTKGDLSLLAQAREAIPTIDVHPLVCGICKARGDAWLEEYLESPKASRERTDRSAISEAIADLPPEELSHFLAKLVQNGLPENVAEYIRYSVAVRAPMFIQLFCPVVN